MSTAKINFKSKMNRETFSNLTERELIFKSKRAEKIAWIIFFGIGVSYFVTTLFIAIF